MQGIDIDNMKARIEEALETVRPYLRSDGGDVRLHALTEEMEVQLELLGNCESCSMSHMTMKAGLEETIKKMVPEVKAVTAVNA